jgi:hypothetical protein
MRPNYYNKDYIPMHLVGLYLTMHGPMKMKFSITVSSYHFSMAGTGVLFLEKLLRRFSQMNQMVPSLFETAVTIITFSH